MFEERRRDVRFITRIPATIAQRLEPAKLETVDVSFHGLLFFTAVPPPLGQLVRVTVMPEDDAPIVLECVPVRWGACSRTERMAVGARLMGAPERWDRLVRELRSSSMSGIRVRPQLAELERAAQAFRAARGR
jgi:hypothetical protein